MKSTKNTKTSTPKRGLHRRAAQRIKTAPRRQKALLAVGILLIAGGMLWLNANANPFDVQNHQYYPCDVLTSAQATAEDTGCVAGGNSGKSVKKMKTLFIKEWGVRVPLGQAIPDATYTYDKTEDRVHLSSTTLAKAVKSIDGCRAGLDNLYYTRAKAGDRRSNYSQTDTWQAADLQAASSGIGKIGAYYYFPASVVELACAAQLPKDKAERIHTAHKALRSAFAQGVLVTGQLCAAKQASAAECSNAAGQR